MYQRILVPVDGSPTSTGGLDEAIRLASLVGAQLRLVHVLDDIVIGSGFETAATYLHDVLPMRRKAGERILEDARTRVASAGLAVDTVLVENVGHRTSEIVVAQANAWHAELIVLGTHGRRGVGRFVIGSDAEQILRMAPVPVLLVRGEPSLDDVPVGTTAPTV